MFESRNRQRIVAAAVLAFALSASAWAARRIGPERPTPLPARVGIFSDEIVWEPWGDFEAATLIVRGPDGEVVRTVFGPGVAPAFRLASLKTAPADGRYFWEIGFTPRLSPALREPLREAAENDDWVRIAELNRLHRIRHQDLVQTGQFLVHEGRIEADENDLNSRELAAEVKLATSPLRPRGPLATFDVSGDWTLTGDLGIGTDTPSQEVDIVDASPTIQMEDSSSAFSWFVNGNDSGFDVRRTGNTTSDRVFFLDAAAPKPSLWVDNVGNWGNGTSAPSFPLHLVRSDGTARLRVEEQSGVTASRTLFELRNNGGAFFSIRNTNAAATWSFSVSAVGAFQIDNPSVGGGAEAVFFNTGAVRMGPGGVQRFLLDPAGNLTIAGNLTANMVFYPSDRNLKENFAPVDPNQILSRVVDLPITRWNFKSDEAAAVHIGPTAQDFHRLFDLSGDNRHLNLPDLAGVALAAIQGLNRKLEEQNARVAELQSKIDSQQTEIERLKARLAQRAKP